MVNDPRGREVNLEKTKLPATPGNQILDFPKSTSVHGSGSSWCVIPMRFFGPAKNRWSDDTQRIPAPRAMTLAAIAILEKGMDF
jgi:hypothetical protein